MVLKINNNTYFFFDPNILQLMVDLLVGYGEYVKIEIRLYYIRLPIRVSVIYGYRKRNIILVLS